MIKPSPEQTKKWIEKNFGKNYKLTKRGQEIRINNPLSIDGGFHLWINLRKSLVNDFRPDYKSSVAGTFLSFVMKYRNVSFKEAVREVMGDVDYSRHNVVIYGDISAPDAEIELPSGFQKLTYEDNKISAMVKSYLNSRMVSNGKAYVLSVGYCGLNVVFPYREFGKIVYWQQRSIIDKTFLFPAGTNKSKFIFGIDTIDPSDPVIITESIFNSLMFDNGVACGGSDISDEQKRKLRKIGVKSLIVAFDGDKSGIFGVAKAFSRLSSYFKLFYSLPDDEQDWNDLAMNYGLDESLKILKRNLKKLDYKAMVNLKRLAS